jgi:adenylosuccinate lyase
VIAPEATVHLDFAIARLTLVVTRLVVYPARMRRNLERMGGLVHSQQVLLALTQAGMSREEAYAAVQRNAMRVWEADGALSLRALLAADPHVTARLSPEALDRLFALEPHVAHVESIFARVFGPR